MSVVGVLRGAADAPPATNTAALAVDHSTLERATPPAALFPSHPVAPGQAAGSAQAGTTAAPTAMLAEQAFKNVTALKGISAADFMGTMGIMSASLGFDCSECHNAAGTDKVDWAHDTPRKIIARRMVNMVAAINKDNFGGRQLVTCWSCHRNRDKPVVTPNLDFVYGMPPLEPDDLVPASVPGLKKPDEIIDRYLNAIGGAQKLAAMTSVTAVGTSTGFAASAAARCSSTPSCPTSARRSSSSRTRQAATPARAPSTVKSAGSRRRSRCSGNTRSAVTNSRARSSTRN